MVEDADEVVKAFQQFGIATEEFAQKVAEEMAPIMREMMEQVQVIYDLIRAEYVAQGAIYGDTREGMMRWLTELGEIQSHLQKAREIKQRQEWAKALNKWKTAG